MIAITAKYIHQGDHWAENVALVIEGGKIKSLIPEDEIPAGADIRGFGDDYLAPGLFDIQVNGGGDLLLNDAPTADTLLKIAAAHLPLGSTSMLPTLITDQLDVMQRTAEAIETVRDAGHHQIKGVHFEGPYLNSERKGVHPARFIRQSEQAFLDLLDRHDLGACLVTLAPENTDDDFIGELLKRGVILSMGHTAATYDQAVHAANLGITGLTHLYNAMPPHLSREPGPIGTAFENENLFASVIADGHHIHPSPLKSALRLLGDDRAMLITDAMPPVGGSADHFNLLGLDVFVKNGTCLTKDGTLAGACISMWDAVSYCRDILKLPMMSCLKMASATPARFMGLGAQIGSLKPGFDADFICFDRDGRLKSVHIGSEF